MTHMDCLRKRAQEMSRAEVENEIKLREEWIGRCMGELYPSILRNEIWELKSWLSAK